MEGGHFCFCHFGVGMVATCVQTGWIPSDGSFLVWFPLHQPSRAPAFANATHAQIAPCLKESLGRRPLLVSSNKTSLMWSQSQRKLRGFHANQKQAAAEFPRDVATSYRSKRVPPPQRHALRPRKSPRIVASGRRPRRSKPEGRRRRRSRVENLCTVTPPQHGWFLGSCMRKWGGF